MVELVGEGLLSTGPPPSSFNLSHIVTTVFSYGQESAKYGETCLVDARIAEKYLGHSLKYLAGI